MKITVKHKMGFGNKVECFDVYSNLIYHEDVYEHKDVYESDYSITKETIAVVDLYSFVAGCGYQTCFIWGLNTQIYNSYH